MHPLDTAWQSVVHEFDQANAVARRESRVETTKHLNQIVRRISQYKSESDWLDAVLDGACAFAPQAAVFSVEGGGQLRLRGSRCLELPANLTFPASSAAAFADAIESRDTVVVLRTVAEVGEDLALESADASPDRCYLLPIRNQSRIAALIFVPERADGEFRPNATYPTLPNSHDAPDSSISDVNALELIAQVSSAVLERAEEQMPLVNIAVAQHPSAPKAVLPSWADLNETERNLHIRAQRFARTKVAEMQLYKPELSRKGAQRQDLYLYLKPEIDAAREAYRTQFLTVESMVDYLHLEVSSSLAHGNEMLLGPDYPGQMV